MRIKGRCPKCRKVRTLTSHHIYPKVWFCDETILRICRLCHDDLEVLISFAELGEDDLRYRLPTERYERIVHDFLRRKVSCHYFAPTVSEYSKKEDDLHQTAQIARNPK